MTESISKERLHSDPSNEQLIQEIRNGNVNAQDILLQKFKTLVRIKSSAYYIIGGDKEDIIQEGMIGLYKAIRDYNPEKKISFYTFAIICINRQILSAIKASKRQKHIPLNSSLPTETIDLNYTVETVKYINDPETLLIDREEKSDIEAHIHASLSEMECHVLSLHLQGQRYSEIAHILKKDEKSVDNALQRVRRKIEKIFSLTSIYN